MSLSRTITGDSVRPFEAHISFQNPNRNVMLAVRFSVDAFRQVEKVALCAYFSEIFFFF